MPSAATNFEKCSLSLPRTIALALFSSVGFVLVLVWADLFEIRQFDTTDRVHASSALVHDCKNATSDLRFEKLFVTPTFSSTNRVNDAILNRARADRRPGVHVPIFGTVYETIERLVDAFIQPWETSRREFLQPDYLRRMIRTNDALANISVLVDIVDNKVRYESYYEPANRHSRRKTLEPALSRLTEFYNVPNCTFVVVLNDGNMFPNIPTFSAARHWHTWNDTVPVPLGNHRGIENGWGNPIVGWNEYRRHFSERRSTPWETKESRAVFRANFHMQRYKLGSCILNCTLATHWREVNRGALYANSRNETLFDVGLTGVDEAMMAEGVTASLPMSMEEQQDRYKYIINVGLNQDWAERLIHLFNLRLLVVFHEAETQEWWYPVLEPFVHYLPVDTMMDNLEERINWARENDDKVKEIVENASLLAEQFLTEETMLHYWFVLLSRISSLQE